MPPRSTRARPRLEVLEARALVSTCTVTRLSYAGLGQGLRGDLRYCINYANGNPGPDTIDFKVTGTIKPQSALPQLATEITITGPGANLLAVDPNGLSFRVFTVPASGVVSISGLTVTHGFANHEYGGGILNAGQLTLVACAVSKNASDGSTTGGAAGGGIYNTGTLTVRDSTISDNRVDSVVYIVSGAGIYNSGQLFLDNSTVSGNVILGYPGDGYGGG